MKVKPYRKCDLCGKQYDKTENCLKIKLKRGHWIPEHSWNTNFTFTKLDICPGCGNALLQTIKEVMKEKEHEN